MSEIHSKYIVCWQSTGGTNGQEVAGLVFTRPDVCMDWLPSVIGDFTKLHVFFFCVKYMHRCWQASTEKYLL